MADITRKGYGQVEPNHLSAQYTGQIYAQLPAMQGNDHKTPTAQLENGQFLKYNYKDNVASIDGDGEWLLVFNEVKLYDERRQSYKDFCMKASEQSDKKIYPRLLKTNIGDIFTTNTFGTHAEGPDTEQTFAEFTIGQEVGVNATTGFLTTDEYDPDGPVFQVVKIYTLADKQPAVKLQRIQ